MNTRVKQIWGAAATLADMQEWDSFINSFDEVLFREDVSDGGGYQGDTRLLLKQDGKLGYLCFGWGSCSGCDALYACTTVDEVEELMEYLVSQIRWFENAADGLNFLRTHDWAGDYCHPKEFVEGAIKVLEELPE